MRACVIATAQSETETEALLITKKSRQIKKENPMTEDDRGSITEKSSSMTNCKKKDEKKKACYE